MYSQPDLNIPFEMINDHYGMFANKTIQGLFLDPSNTAFLKSRIDYYMRGGESPKPADAGSGASSGNAHHYSFDVDRYIANYRLPGYWNYKYKDPKEMLSVYNTIFLKNVRHVLATLADEDQLRGDTRKWGLTDESFAGGLYTPEDYFMNTIFTYNHGPAWKRRVVDLKTSRKNELKKAVVGPCAEEYPGGVPFYRWAPFLHLHDFKQAAEGLNDNGEGDRRTAVNSIRYDMTEIIDHASSQSSVEPWEILPRGSI